MGTREARCVHAFDRCVGRSTVCVRVGVNPKSNAGGGAPVQSVCIVNSHVHKQKHKRTYGLLLLASFLSWALMCAPLARRRVTISPCPPLHAQNSGVCPAPSRALLPSPRPDEKVQGGKHQRAKRVPSSDSSVAVCFLKVRYAYVHHDQIKRRALPTLETGLRALKMVFIH